MATRFDPFREMDRLVEQAFGTARSAAAMPMDLFRSGDHYLASFDLPGVDPASIDVTVEDRTLTIRAKRTSVSDEGVQWLVRERADGTYARQLTLGRGVALDDIEASYTNGVLTLAIPVAEQAKPRRISVSHDAGEVASSEEQRSVTAS